LFQIGQYQVISPIMSPNCWDFGRDQTALGNTSEIPQISGEPRTINNTIMRHGPHHKQVIDKFRDGLQILAGDAHCLSDQELTIRGILNL
jgi:hypothetical protein